MRNFQKYGFDNRGRMSGQMRCTCPKCRENRSHPGDRSVALNLDSGLWYCHHCGEGGYVPDENEEREREEKKRRAEQKRQMKPSANGHPRPEWHPEFLTLHPTIEEYFTIHRGLSKETLYKAKVTGEWVNMSNDGKTELCMVFNYFDHDVLINKKFRTIDKRFRLHRGAELIPYNINAIRESDICYITEGEFDTLTMIQCGFPETISVPNGGKSNLNWLDRFVETHFEDKKTIILALDEDPVGIQLRDELVRRLGIERCKLVHWSDDCKDANDELMRHGTESVVRCVKAAFELPINGMFTASDVADDFLALFENGLQHGADTGLVNFDKLASFEPGRFIVVTGRPGEGKSEFIDELVLRLCLRHEWKVAYFSPENDPFTYHLRKLSEKLTGYPFQRSAKMTDQLFHGISQWLDNNICHIQPGGDEAYTLDNILHIAHQLVARRGIRILVVDPLNRIEQRLEGGQTELQYISSLLNRLVRFARQNHCIVLLVAHPRKVNRATLDGRKRRVEMNDINGSADFGNKADYCFVVDRDDELHVTTVYVDKVRFKHLGSRGECTFFYDIVSGRYQPCDVDEVYDSQKGMTTKGAAHIRWQNIRWVNEEGCSILLNEEERLSGSKAAIDGPTLF